MEPTRSWQQVNGVTLHVVEAGPADGPLLILLHGFPDCWWGWRRQIGFLARQGFRVVVPDQRGYNRSSKPPGRAAYTLDVLAADVIGLAAAYGRARFRVVGHDWGGLVAWWTAAHYPDRVEKLIAINAPHPDAWRRFMRHRLRQALRSYYVAFFQLPWLPELILRANSFRLLRRALTASARPGTFSPRDLMRYVATWQQPGALTAMLHYYRALRSKPAGPPPRISVPTLVMWGVHDRFLEREAARASLALCERGEARFVEKATHWVLLEEPDVVNEALREFLLRNEPPETPRPEGTPAHPPAA